MRSKQMSPHQRSIGVAVEDADNLRHARTAVNMCDAKPLLVFGLLPNICDCRSVVLTEQFHARFAAQQRHNIIRKQVALVGEESVSGVTGTTAGLFRRPTDARLYHRQ